MPRKHTVVSEHCRFLSQVHTGPYSRATCVLHALKQRSHFSKVLKCLPRWFFSLQCLFLSTFLSRLVSRTPGFESSVCQALELWSPQTAHRISSSCSVCQQLEGGPWACPAGRGQRPGDPTCSLVVRASYIGMFVLVPDSKEKAIRLDSNCLKNEKTPIRVQMMVFCVYVRVWNFKGSTELTRWHYKWILSYLVCMLLCCSLETLGTMCHRPAGPAHLG